MRLPAHVLQQIVGHPVSHFSGSGRKRALGRVTLEMGAEVFAIHGDLVDDPIGVTMHDISAETVGVSSPEAMMPGGQMAIRIPLADGEAIALRCRVTRCVRQADGRFALVAQFVSLFDVQLLERSE
jgi:hypothetical protein